MTATVIKTELATASQLSSCHVAVAGTSPEQITIGSKHRLCTSDGVFVWVRIESIIQGAIVGKVTACYQQNCWGISKDNFIEFQAENIVNPYS